MTIEKMCCWYVALSRIFCVLFGFCYASIGIEGLSPKRIPLGESAKAMLISVTWWDRAVHELPSSSPRASAPFLVASLLPGSSSNVPRQSICSY